MRRADKHGGVDPGIPVSDGVEQNDRRHKRRRKRNHDLPKNPHVPRAVDLRRFADGVVDRFHAVFEHDNRHGVAASGNDHGAHGIGEIERPDHQIEGDNPAVKEHRHNDKYRQGALKHEVFSRQDIGRQQIEHKAERRRADRIDNRVEIAAPQVMIGKKKLIPLERELQRLK